MSVVSLEQTERLRNIKDLNMRTILVMPIVDGELGMDYILLSSLEQLMGCQYRFCESRRNAPVQQVGSAIQLLPGRAKRRFQKSNVVLARFQWFQN